MGGGGLQKSVDSLLLHMPCPPVFVIESNLDPKATSKFGLPGVRSVRSWLLIESRTRVPSYSVSQLTGIASLMGGERTCAFQLTDDLLAGVVVDMSSSFTPILAQGLALLGAIRWPSRW